MNLIFDIGANVGQFTAACIKKYPNAKIISIEANPNLISILRKFESNNVIVLNNAVSDKSDEMIDFYISNMNVLSTAHTDWMTKSRFTGKAKWADPIKVKTINLDDLIKIYGNPDLIKIDVEGYEYTVMKGLTSKQKDICFEWAEEEYDNINKSCEYLESLGYKNFGFIYKDAYLVKPDNFKSWRKLEIHQDIDVKRKNKWGMIWCN